MATSKVILGWVLTSDSVHLCRLHSAAILGSQATGILTQHSTQSHYPDTELSHFVPYPIIVLMPSARLGSDKYQFYKS